MDRFDNLLLDGYTIHSELIKTGFNRLIRFLVLHVQVKDQFFSVIDGGLHPEKGPACYRFPVNRENFYFRDSLRGPGPVQELHDVPAADGGDAHADGQK